MEQTISSYIEKFILKSGEELESNPQNTNCPFLEVKMIKRTNRRILVPGTTRGQISRLSMEGA
jgi:hypothetical protein